MTDGDPTMTWEQKVDHAAITLLVPACVAWMAVELTARPGVAGRHAGAVLELLGFGIAAYGLQEKVAQVTDRPGLRDRAVRWVDRLWRRLRTLFGWEPKGRTVSIKASGKATAGGTVRASVTTGPDASLDHRIDVLEQEIAAIREWIKDVQQEGREERTELKDDIAHLRDDLREVEEKLENLIRRLAIGSLHWEATGLLWFALGVVTSTWPGALPGV